MASTQRFRWFDRVDIENIALDVDSFEGHSSYCQFIILGKGRSGSNFLRGLLNSHSQAIVFGELFRDYDAIGWEFPDYDQYLQSQSLVQAMQNDPINFLRTKIFRNYPEQILAIGFKLFYYHAQNDSRQVIWSFFKEQRAIKIIHLNRNNTLRELLSLRKAFKTNHWTNITGQPEEQLSIFLDYEDCLREFTHTQEIRQQYNQFFQEHPMIHVCYEDLSSNCEQEMKRVQEFLEIDREPVKPSTYKQSNQPLSEAITNYFELKQRFQGTPWSDFFED